VLSIRYRHRPRRVALAAALALLSFLTACDDEPEECKRLPEGEFTFHTDPARFGEAYSFSAAVQSIEFIPGDPAVHEYRLRASPTQTVVLTVNDNGAPLPIETGQTYAFEVQAVGGVPAAQGIRISDAGGLRYMAVTDWRPNYTIFPDGYGSLGAAGRLQAFFGDAGCDPREEDTACFHEIRNYRLEFVLGGTRRVKLWNGQDARLEGWRFHLHKASRVQVKVGCSEGLQQQISFFVERDGIRSS